MFLAHFLHLLSKQFIPFGTWGEHVAEAFVEMEFDLELRTQFLLLLHPREVHVFSIQDIVDAFGPECFLYVADA